MSDDECTDQASDALTVPVLVKVAVLIPITRAEESNNGPPEFPALMAASVCTTPSPAQMACNTADAHCKTG